MNPAKSYLTTQISFALITQQIEGRQKEQNMVEILLVAYLILGLMAGLVIWAAVKTSKRREEARDLTYKSLETKQFSKSRTQKTELHSP